MNQNSNEEMEDLINKTPYDLGYQGKGKNIRYRKVSLDTKQQRKFLLLGSAGILLLIAIFTVSFRAGNRYSADALTSIRSRVDKLGERLKHMEKMEVRIVHLEKQGKEFTQFISTLDRSDNILREQLNKLAKEIERLQKRMPSVAAKHKTPQAMQEKPISKAETGYHEVRPGDTLFKIAKEYGIHVDELCRLNNLTRSQIIHPGQKLMVAPGDHQ